MSGKARKLSDNAIVAAWSPDGKRLACSRGVRMPWESFLLDIATGKEEPLPLPKTDYVCDWSPDGHLLAVLAYNPDKTFKHPTKGTYPLRKLYLFHLGDHQRHDLIADPLSDNIWPRFSPDGRWLAYHQRMQCIGRVPYDAVVYDLKKDCSKEVLSFNKTFPGYMDFRANGFPCWSCDGQQIGWLAPLHHWWPQPSKMALVVARKAGGLAQQLNLYERGLRFVYAVDWR